MNKKTNLQTWLAISVFLLAIQCATALGDIIYVDANASPGGDGLTWGTAYKYLQDALAEAQSNDEIWVAQGTYTPDCNSLVPNGTGDREATFQLITGVALYGGFPSGGGNWEQRDPNQFETILSGDLNDDDVEVEDPAELQDEPSRSENSYHVVTGSGTDPNTILDGFIITAGNANGSNPYNKGAGCTTRPRRDRRGHLEDLGGRGTFPMTRVWTRGTG